LARIAAVAADIWAHAVGFAAVEFEAVGAPHTAATEITKRTQKILLTTEDSSTILCPFGPILRSLKKKGRRADQKRTPRHRAIRAESHNLKSSPSRGSQGEKFRASAKERKVIIKRDLKLAISSWRLWILVSWLSLKSSPNMWGHGDSWRRAF
jgi:hypothetical protein